MAQKVFILNIKTDIKEAQKKEEKMFRKILDPKQTN